MEQISSPLKKSYNFFLIVNPGLEDLAQKELLEKTALYDIEILMHLMTEGGIEVSAGLEAGLSLNHILKIPTRILLRIANFKVRDFPKLFNKIKKLGWNEYLNGGIPTIKASTIKSRLLHSGRIEKTIQDGIRKYYTQTQIKKKYLEHKDNDTNKIVYARVKNDEMVLSLDTSGTPLYKRNNWDYRSPAALRETFSAAVFYDFKNTIPQKMTSILDPFAGTGTLLVEALNFDQPNLKDFIYTSFPICENILIKMPSKPKPLQSLKAFEIDKEIYQKTLPQIKLYEKIQYLNQDSLKQQEQADFILTNPPYGMRIEKIKDNLNLLVEKLYQNYQFKYLGILHPEAFKETDELRLVKKRKFSNNSIDVYFNIIKANNV